MRHFLFKLINIFSFITHKNLVITQENKQENKTMILWDIFTFKFHCPKNWKQISVLGKAITGFHKADSLHCETWLFSAC